MVYHDERKIMFHIVLSGFGRGTYVLILHLRDKKEILVGGLGSLVFLTGYYAYVGSAFGPGGLAARIGHHLKSASRPRWHIDYLRRESVPAEAWISEQDARRETAWASIMRRMKGVKIPVRGFGSSDSHRESHLFSFDNRPRLHLFRKLVREVFPDDDPIRRLKFRSDAAPVEKAPSKSSLKGHRI
jgi:Uri superfamily endonuclease